MVGTIEDWLKVRPWLRRAAPKDHSAEVIPMTRRTIPKQRPLDEAAGIPVARLDIPLNSQVNLRRAAEILKGLANQLDVLSRNTDLAPKHALLTARDNIRAANGRLRAMRRKKGEE
jgi:hypothetical protein